MNNAESQVDTPARRPRRRVLQIVVHLLLPVLLLTAFVAIQPSSKALALNTIGPGGGGSSGGGGGTAIPGSGTVCWSLTGDPGDPGAICFGCPCAACLQTPTQVPLDNNTLLDFQQEGSMGAYGPSGGWTCGIPGPSAPPPFSFPPFSVAGVVGATPGSVTPSFTGPYMLVNDKQTAHLNNCPLTTALMSPATSTPKAPAGAPPPVGASPPYAVSYLFPPNSEPCANAMTINGQDANYTYELYEINVLDPHPGCNDSAPYEWNWGYGASVPGSTFCGGRTTTYTYHHVVQAPGAGIQAKNSTWQPYCGGWVYEAFNNTTTWFPLSPNPQTQNGITMTCDPAFGQSFGTYPQRPVVQIEPLIQG